MTWTVAIGVDTHKDTHVAVACDALGRQLDAIELDASVGGYVRLWEWATELGRPAFALEGAGSYGAGLAHFLIEAGVLVYECERPSRRDRRRGKNDWIDAALAARRLCTGEGLARLRGGGRREELRILLLERRSARRARTAALNQLHALVLAAPPSVRARLQELDAKALVERVRRLRLSDEQRTLACVLRRLGGRIRALSAELDELDRELVTLVEQAAPELLKECGVGAVCAAQLIVSSGEPGRMRSEASSAALAGTSPVEASSGRQQRHRLNRGGDRQLNHALHMIALNRLRYDSRTSAYYQRLLADGKSRREALRCVKRTLARYFYRHLQTIASFEEPVLA
jgi:transposase